ncbi:MAG: DUF3788 domain-containing protein [Clostridia bacterium]|nr:DUF3788 domain-containing protein [Clostridia bacterium]
MFDRMLDKFIEPTLSQMTDYCGDSATRFINVNRWLTEQYKTVQNIEFPYGTKYGWCVAHRIGSRFICNIFPEQQSFTVMLRMSSVNFDAVRAQLCDYTNQVIDNKYPCGNGGWIHLRILNDQHLLDVQVLLNHKITHK